MGEGGEVEAGMGGKFSKWREVFLFLSSFFLSPLSSERESEHL